MADGAWSREAERSALVDAFESRHTLALTVTIRRSVAGDLPGLEWFGVHTPHREIIATAFRNQEGKQGFLLVADVNGFPVGQIGVDAVRKRHLGRATLWALRVFQPFRGLGIGRRLMQAAEQASAGCGFTAVELGVDRDNASVLPFYEGLGYAHCGTERGHFRYRTPKSAAVHIPIDQWLLSKRLDNTAACITDDANADQRLAAE